ncbi:MAG: SIS domain-containing protein [Clostridia bacterium]|nr:SIS domain-containing protein [Clostridia bacterium]
MSVHVSQYQQFLHSAIDRIVQTQMQQIDRAADVIASAIRDKRSVFGFAPMHAGIVIEELVYRAGGLATINPIVSPILQFTTRPLPSTSEFERLPGHAEILLRNSGIKPGDVLIVHACSGRVPTVVEMPMKAREMGVTVIGIYSEQYAGHVSSLDPSGTMTQDHCDILIDNCGVMGDACVQLEGMAQRVAPSSTVTGAFIANSIVILVCEKLLSMGIEPPVYRSANLEGGREFNALIMEEYKDVIHYL